MSARLDIKVPQIETATPIEDNSVHIPTSKEAGIVVTDTAWIGKHVAVHEHKGHIFVYHDSQVVEGQVALKAIFAALKQVANHA